MTPPEPDWATRTVGIAATTAMLVYTMLGLPAQLLRLRRAGSAEGVSALTFGLSFLAFALFTAYGALKPDLFIVLSNAPGTLLAGLILLQIWAHRRAAEARSNPVPGTAPIDVERDS